METYNIKKKTNVHWKAIKINRQQITNVNGVSNKALVKQWILKTTCLPPILHFLLCKCLSFMFLACHLPYPHHHQYYARYYHFCVIYDPLEGPRACSLFAFLLYIISQCS